MDVAKQSWQEIAKELSKEADPQRRQKLERDLGSALGAGWFSEVQPTKTKAQGSTVPTQIVSPMVISHSPYD